MGSTFRVLLPFAVIDQAVRESHAPAATLSTHWPGRKLKVLLVEDNEINQRFGLTLLKKMGHQVFLAEDGKDALAALGQTSFDVVLMDIRMPIMDGEQALAVLREREAQTGAHLPVIALTAHALKGDEEKFHIEGFDGYLTKPLGVMSLVAEMQRVLILKALPDGHVT